LLFLEHPRLEEHRATPTAALGMVHGEIGGLDQNVEILGDRRGARHSAARADLELLRAEDERFPQGRYNAFGFLHSRFRLWSVEDDRAEFIATEARQLDT